MAWVFLVGAIICEVAGTVSLRAAATGDRRWYVAVLSFYVSAFVLLSLALRLGIPLGVAYGIWAAMGVALTALASRFLFHEPLTRVMTAGLALIVVGVLLIELGAAH